MNTNAEYGIAGYFRCTVRKANSGAIVSDTGLFKNLITNFGMNRLGMRLGGYGVMRGCTVGRSTTPESVNDVSIGIFAARTDISAPSGDPSVKVGSTTSPYYAKCTATWRFPEGSVTGNISEVGVIAVYDAPGYELWSRTLIKDSDGSPVTITVLPDEILDVYYEARLYPQEVPTTGVATIGATTYNYKVCSSNLVSPSHASVFLTGFGQTADDYCYAYTGPLDAAPSLAPTGDNLGNRTSVAGAAYVNNSFTKSITYAFAPGNVTDNIRSFSIMSSHAGPTYSIELTPAYTKASTVELKVTHTVTWSRRST